MGVLGVSVMSWITGAYPTNTTRIVNVPGRSPVTRKRPSAPAIAPAIVTVDPLSRSETDARGSGAFAVSTILPRSSNDGAAAGGAGDWAASTRFQPTSMPLVSASPR
jgi:hypothetical protein